MVTRLFFLLTIVPIIELYLLIKVGSVIGALNTVILLIGTTIFGVFLVRLEGSKTLSRISNSLSQGIVPAEELVDALLVFAAGVLLIMPGIFSDILALFLLIPVSRTLFKRWLRRKLERLVASGQTRIYFHGRG
jgi:UPF0716 protein FxsA